MTMSDHSRASAGTGAAPASARVRARTKRRRAYVLMIVLGLAIVSFSVGTAYLDAYASVIPEAKNQMASSRATYLAGSGVDVACHYLLYPPDGVAAGDYWSGGNRMRVDSSDDWVSVQVAQNDSDPEQYQIDSFGVAYDTDGNARAKRGVRAEVMVRPDSMIEIPYALQAGGMIAGDNTIHVNGDMYSKGMMQWSGDCTGNVSSSSTILWLSFTPPASSTSFAPTVETPTIDVSLYDKYVVNGTTCNAYHYDDNEMTASDADSINSALDSATDNPGRIVVVRTGDFKMKVGADFRGTLVVDGDLGIKGSGPHRIIATRNLPAVVCSQSITIEDDSATLMVYGAALCDTLDVGGKSDVSITLTGALVTADAGGIVDENGSGNAITLTHNDNYAKYYDFSVTGMPYTIISWTDY